MAEKKTIRFKQNHAGFNSGEAADFSAEDAHRLVTAGLAQHGKFVDGEFVADPIKVKGTLEQLVAEVKAAGYSDAAAEKIGKERFDGVYGEEAKFLHPEEELEYDDEDEDDDETMTEEQYRAELGKKTKADLVALAKAELGLELSEDSKKDELVDAIVAATVKK